MDDFVLLHRDKAYLRECLIHLKAMFKNELHLEFNTKTQVLPIKNGVNYLGWQSKFFDMCNSSHSNTCNHYVS